MNEAKIKELAAGLSTCVCDDIHGRTPAEGALDDYPVLRELKGTALADAVASLRDILASACEDSAREYVEEQQNQNLQCRNPRCEVSSMPLGALKAPFPDPRLIETISPGDTVPQGLCPSCGSPVYQVEIHPEDEACQGDDFCGCAECTERRDKEPEPDWDADCDCRDCRQERRRTELIGKGVHPDRAAEQAAESRARWDNFGGAVGIKEVTHKSSKPYVDPQHADPCHPPVEHCACKYCIKKRCAQHGVDPKVAEALASSPDNTGSIAEGSMDCTGDFIPVYTE